MRVRPSPSPQYLGRLAATWDEAAGPPPPKRPPARLVGCLVLAVVACFGFVDAAPPAARPSPPATAPPTATAPPVVTAPPPATAPPVVAVTTPVTPPATAPPPPAQPPQQVAAAPTTALPPAARRAPAHLGALRGPVQAAEYGQGSGVTGARVLPSAPAP